MKTTDPVGYAAHWENFIVFACVGVCLGVAAAVEFDQCSMIKSVSNVVVETIAIRIFLLLTSIGLIGTAIGKCQRLPHFVSNIFLFCALPLLRAGLSAGFIGFGVLVGFGISVGLISYVFNFFQLLEIGKVCLIIAFKLISILLPFTLFSSELLSVSSVKFNIITACYSLLALYVLVKYGQITLWQYALSAIVLFGAGIYIFSKQGNRQKLPAH